MRLLIAEDDPRLLKSLLHIFTSNQYAADGVSNGTDALDYARTGEYDGFVFDIMMPGTDGLTVLSTLRREGITTPTLFLTARTEVDQRVEGLDAGADDYLPKPFNPRELLARLHAVLRRRPEADQPGAPTKENETVRFGHFELDLGRRELRKDGKAVTLTTGEFSVMKAFARHPRVPLSREKLMEMARGREYEAFDRSLDVQVSRLRKLIEIDPSKPRYLQTVWGLGYVFIPDDPESSDAS